MRENRDGRARGIMPTIVGGEVEGGETSRSHDPLNSIESAVKS